MTYRHKKHYSDVKERCPSGLNISKRYNRRFS